ncbi:SAM-dependent methyltransferase [Nonomuraea soli]|uniref:SAM-dependent methyltransferase n=1 Tax=Nonomuraea soli TaxID=1032476 RepID=A0A7W0CL31_9ACTN|nr:methyltransferase [Nonomuraea soli]MBA2892925.1 SAM-dependent methyltransferase [Nonomuraea soli]
MPLHLTPDDAAPYLDGRAPGAHLDVIGAMTVHAVAAALRLGVFAALGAPADAPTLARTLDADPAALTVLLDVLVATGYLAREGPRYRLTPLAGTLDWYGDSLLFWHEVTGELWSGLTESIRGGGRGADFYTWLGDRPEARSRFETILYGQADWLSTEIVTLAPPPPGATRLLDLGGGHARYSLAYCAAHPRLHATVADLPAALDAGMSAAKQAGLDERVTFDGRDLTAALPYRDQDCVLLFNLLHGFPAARARALVAAAAGTLRPGGRLIILERDPDRAADPVTGAFSRLFALNLHHTQGGTLHTLADLAAWARECGLTEPGVADLTRSPAHRLLIADLPPGTPRP